LLSKNRVCKNFGEKEKKGLEDRQKNEWYRELGVFHEKRVRKVFGKKKKGPKGGDGR